MTTVSASKLAQGNSAEPQGQSAKNTRATNSVDLFKRYFTSKLMAQVRDLAAEYSADRRATPERILRACRTDPSATLVLIEDYRIDASSVDLKRVENYLITIAYCIAKEKSLEQVLKAPASWPAELSGIIDHLSLRGSQRTDSEIPDDLLTAKLRDIAGELDASGKARLSILDQGIPEEARKIIRLRLIDGNYVGAFHTAERFSADTTESLWWLSREKSEAASINRELGRAKMAEQLDAITPYVIPEMPSERAAAPKYGGSPQLHFSWPLR